MKEILIGFTVAGAVIITYLISVSVARTIYENARLSCPASIVECPK